MYTGLTHYTDKQTVYKRCNVEKSYIYTFTYDLASIIWFSQLTYSADEGDGAAQPVLILSNPSSSNTTVQVKTKKKTATGE